MPIEYEVIITIDNKQEIQTADNLEFAYTLFDSAVSECRRQKKTVLEATKNVS